MSDTATQQPALSEGYRTITFEFRGSTYTYRFYEGFVGKIWFHPPAGQGPDVLVYQQEGIYFVPGGKPPATRTTVTVTGGPLALDIELDVDDGPVDPVTKKGPIESITVDFKRKGSPFPAPPGRVRAVKGADQIERLVVKERVKVGKGGVFGHQGGSGGGTSVENNAATCPFTCP